MKSRHGIFPFVGALTLLFTYLFAPFAAGQARPSTGVEKTKDGWEVASPSEEKLDAAMINSLLEKVRSGVYRNVRSMIVARNGKLVVEEYFPRTEADRREQALRRVSPVESTSATKS